MVRSNYEMAVGLQLEPGCARMTVCDSLSKEPRTVGQGEEGAEEDSLVLPDMNERVWKSACGLGEPIQIFADFVRDSLDRYIKGTELATLRIMVTVPRLEPLISQRVPQALELLGVARKNIYLQDYQTSFFHYTVNQRKELWNGDVALFTFEGDNMVGRVMHFDWTRTPVLVSTRRIAAQKVTEKERDGRDEAHWAQEKDRLFFELLGKVFERRSVVTSYLVGDFFDQSWAVRSFQFLVQRRHAFQGCSLFTKGACYGAMQRAGMVREAEELLYLGADIVRENVGMQMRVLGKEMYYPLVKPGINWFEAHHECEFIPEDETDIRILTRPMEGGSEVTHILRLPGFPRRPDRASRLRLTTYFTSARQCVIEVEDKGFGGLFKSSGKKWKRTILLG
ncbi:MAG: DUF5716 family protein [Lachnospiraceae bacterium]|nr:DUF5716 family protein [Lachnospiraceae bacterium]